MLGAVALAQAASKELGKEVVPVFWMASEDHDFEEIASFRIGEHQFTWKQPDAKGPVGYLPTQDLADQLSAWLEQVPLNEAQKKLIQPRLKAYREGKNLADATRQWVRQWAEGLGLLVLDGQIWRSKVRLLHFGLPRWKVSTPRSFKHRPTPLLNKDIRPRFSHVRSIYSTLRDEIVNVSNNPTRSAPTTLVPMH